MFNIYSKFVIASAMMITSLSHLGAIQLVTEVYTEQNKPKEYECAGPGDCTSVTLKGWPKNSTITLDEKQYHFSKAEQKTTLRSVPGVDPIFVIGSIGYIPGMPVTFTFRDRSKHLRKEITFVPNRNYVKSSIDKAQIEAKIVAVKPFLTCSIEFEGFTENEELRFKSISYHEKLENTIKYKAGQPMLYSPGVLNRIGGVAIVSFTRPSGEVLKLDVPWGVEWMKYSQFKDRDGIVKYFIDTPGFKQGFPEAAEYFEAKKKV